MFFAVMIPATLVAILTGCRLAPRFFHDDFGDCFLACVFPWPLSLLLGVGFWENARRATTLQFFLIICAGAGWATALCALLVLHLFGVEVAI